MHVTRANYRTHPVESGGQEGGGGSIEGETCFFGGLPYLTPPSAAVNHRTRGAALNKE